MREISTCGCPSHTPYWELTYNPGICYDWELNQQPYASQSGAQSTEPHNPGPYLPLPGSSVLKHPASAVFPKKNPKILSTSYLEIVGLLSYFHLKFLVLQVNTSHCKDENNRNMKNFKNANPPVMSCSILNLFHSLHFGVQLSICSLIYIKYPYTPSFFCFLFLTM